MSDVSRVRFPPLQFEKLALRLVTEANSCIQNDGGEDPRRVSFSNLEMKYMQGREFFTREMSEAVTVVGTEINRMERGQMELNFGWTAHTAHSPSGKAQHFDCCIHWFESSMGS